MQIINNRQKGVLKLNSLESKHNTKNITSNPKPKTANNTVSWNTCYQDETPANYFELILGCHNKYQAVSNIK